MTTAILMLMLQFVVSTKAGLVNYVQGNASVRATQGVAKGVPITTGSNGFAEVLLNPGSFLRLGPNSEAVLDGVELVDVSLTIVSGTAVIEAAGFTKETPLKVTAGDLKIRIIKDGIYVIEPDQVRVADGQLLIEGNKNVYKKNWVVSKSGALKLSKANPLEVELWSRNRSNLIAMANTNMGNAIRRSPAMASSFYNVWLWDPSFGGFTFMPGSRYRSPYGFSYRNVQEVYYSSGGGSTAGSNSGGGFSNANSNIGGGGTSSSGSSSASSGGGDFGGGGARTGIEGRSVSPPSTSGPTVFRDNSPKQP